MRILIDTNILISAALSNKGAPFAAFKKAVTYPQRIAPIEKILSLAQMTMAKVPIPMEQYDSEMQVRDVNDRPILRATLNAKADILLTGDKDFLEVRVGKS